MKTKSVLTWHGCTWKNCQEVGRQLWQRAAIRELTMVSGLPTVANGWAVDGRTAAAKRQRKSGSMSPTCRTALQEPARPTSMVKLTGRVVQEMALVLVISGLAAPKVLMSSSEGS